MIIAKTRKIRMKLGIGIQQFAEIMGVSVGIVRWWESKREKPSPNDQIRMEELVAINEATFNIRAVRKELKFTATTLAYALGISESRILAHERAIEKGVEKFMPLKYKIDILDLLGHYNVILRRISLPHGQLIKKDK